MDASSGTIYWSFTESLSSVLENASMLLVQRRSTALAIGVAIAVVLLSSWTNVVEASSLTRRSQSQSQSQSKTGTNSALSRAANGGTEDADALTNSKTKSNEEEEEQQQQQQTIEQPPEPEGVYVDKPVLRGKFHKWGAILYPPLLGIPLHLRALSTASATATGGATATPFAAAAAGGALASSSSSASSSSAGHDLVAASLLFSFAVESIMVVSATLHRFPWKSHKWHGVARKVDFTAIFVGIASLYSSMGRLLLGHHDPLWLTVIEPVVWSCAIAGTLLKWWIPDAPPWANASVFLVQGWATLPCVPTLLTKTPRGEASGMVLGGVFVTMGAIAYSLQWPRNVHNKAQREIFFGPHEVFHAGTIFMVVSFWCSMWASVSSVAAANASATVSSTVSSTVSAVIGA